MLASDFPDFIAIGGTFYRHSRLARKSPGRWVIINRRGFVSQREPGVHGWHLQHPPRQGRGRPKRFRPDSGGDSRLRYCGASGSRGDPYFSLARSGGTPQYDPSARGAFYAHPQASFFSAARQRTCERLFDQDLGDNAIIPIVRSSASKFFRLSVLFARGQLSYCEHASFKTLRRGAAARGGHAGI